MYAYLYHFVTTVLLRRDEKCTSTQDRLTYLFFAAVLYYRKDIHKQLLEYELESVGIRLNCRKPNIYFKQQKAGGIKFTSTCTLTRMDEKLVHNILHEYKIFNAEVLFRYLPYIPKEVETAA